MVQPAGLSAQAVHTAAAAPLELYSPALVLTGQKVVYTPVLMAYKPGSVAVWAAYTQVFAAWTWMAYTSVSVAYIQAWLILPPAIVSPGRQMYHTEDRRTVRA